MSHEFSPQGPADAGQLQPGRAQHPTGEPGGKKKPSPLVWIVVAVVTVALAVGGYFLVSNLIGGSSAGYGVNDESGVEDIDVRYVGSTYTELAPAPPNGYAIGDRGQVCHGGGTYETTPSSFISSGSGTTADAVAEIKKMFAAELGDDETASLEEAGTVTLTDANGVAVEMQVLHFTGMDSGAQMDAWLAIHIFPESKSQLMLSLSCADRELPRSEFDDYVNNDVEFTITEK